MARAPWLTLRRLFLLAALAVGVPAAATLYLLFASSERSILERSEAQRQRAAAAVEDRLTAALGIASTALEHVEHAIRYGTLDPSDPSAVEARLFSELLDHTELSDLSFTAATITGYRPDGDAVLGPSSRWQIAAFRASTRADSSIVTRRTSPEGAEFKLATTRYEPGVAWPDGARDPERPLLNDPTAHPTFVTTVKRPYYGRPIWTDPSFSEFDAALPQVERRVVVTVQKAVEARKGGFAGVVRVGLFARTIDALVRPPAGDPERVVLCDAEGRLVARLDPGDAIALVGDDLRVAPAHVPPEIAAALAHPGQSGRLRVGGVDYLATFKPLANSQQWFAAVIAPEAVYTRDLRALRGRVAMTLALLVGLVLLGGVRLLTQLRSALGRVVDVMARMRRFDFAPGSRESTLREVAEVVDGVERAKTSVRALGKYVSLDLVRQLYAADREPEPGGEVLDLSVLFTDIEGFTTLAERLEPDELARALGLYLDAMTRAVTATGGTVDKFIGDAVMAFWNAPVRCADHPRRACRAVLECQRATRALYASDAWRGLPALVTRFGVHTARVMVGHFGAPDRLSYTVLGDGVNLASRLEGLGKQYGVAVLASEAVVRAAGDDFSFRRVDKVAVKGKKEAVFVYELLGWAAECAEKLPAARAYERGLEAYLGGDFGGALARLEALSGDPPSQVLAERCRTMLAHPPAADWDGVYVATQK
ncbi:MAG TPA: adenylate/guanylate cyclase domain-containing protein [Polyangiaceae bacterium]|nr:adenylate/guanylate cyclase domain-containing protein [Polyangiaceae bacterium]